MTTLVEIVIINKSCAIVQHRIVAEKEHISRREHELTEAFWSVGNLVQGIQRLGLGGGLLLTHVGKCHLNIAPQITDTEAAVLFRKDRGLFFRDR